MNNIKQTPVRLMIHVGDYRVRYDTMSVFFISKNNKPRVDIHHSLIFAYKVTGYLQLFALKIYCTSFWSIDRWKD